MKRGWIENPDENSLSFDFKWSLKIKDIEYSKLKDNQIANHFEKNSCLTSKVGICRNIKNLIFSNSVDISNFYPKCYDLEDSLEFEDFIEEFKITRVYFLIFPLLKQWVYYFAKIGQIYSKTVFFAEKWRIFGDREKSGTTNSS